MNQSLSYAASFLLFLSSGFAYEIDAPNPPPAETKLPSAPVSETLSPFTAEVIGNHVRMRIQPALDGDVACELDKGEYVVITGQKGDFYAVTPPHHLKAYIFRGFVIDDVVEGDRVNVRLAPNREAPIIGRYNSGTPIEGTLSSNHPKWLKIALPSDTHCYVVKDYLKYAGDAGLKERHEKRKNQVFEQLESAKLSSKSELLKPFLEIDNKKIAKNYTQIVNDYSDFPIAATQAKQERAKAEREYLQLKVTYLESKASSPKETPLLSKGEKSEMSDAPLPLAIDRIKVWEPIEDSFYLSWSKTHEGSSIEDFYTDQKAKGATTIRGFLTAYHDELLKNKPGDFIVKNRDIPIAYVYSTRLNLQSYVGKEVTLLVSPRPNNQFAFQAFYVLEVN